MGQLAVTNEEESKAVTIPVQSQVRVVVGETYKMVSNYDSNSISECRIEKIYSDQNDVMYLIVTTEVKDKSSWSGYKRYTQSMTASEFKIRVLKGGFDEILL